MFHREGTGRRVEQVEASKGEGESSVQKGSMSDDKTNDDDDNNEVRTGHQDCRGREGLLQRGGLS